MLKCRILTFENFIWNFHDISQIEFRIANLQIVAAALEYLKPDRGFTRYNPIGSEVRFRVFGSDARIPEIPDSRSQIPH